jgi:hypothetical protein
LGKSLLGKGKDLTTLEINELQEIYPEVKNTCVLDGYINKNINEAKRFMSFSLELKPDLIAYYDYLDILFNSYHLGEGEFDNNILFEIEDISLKILRIDNALANNDFLNKTLFLLQYLSENTSNLLATRISNTINLPKEFVQAFKQYIFDNLKDIDKEYPTDFNSYSYFDESIIIVLKSDRFRYPFLYNNKVAEVYDAVRFIVNNYYPDTDYEEIISLLDTFTIKTYAESTSTNLALVSCFIWLWGNIPCGIDLKADSIITRIFKISNHELIGILATALGRKKIDRYNAELINALTAFDFDSRRRIIWAMGEIGTSEFCKIISGLSIDPNNYALIEEQKNALNKLHLTPPH